jgi:hypothetical protein
MQNSKKRLPANLVSVRSTAAGSGERSWHEVNNTGCQYRHRDHENDCVDIGGVTHGFAAPTQADSERLFGRISDIAVK